jgi:hypothetical protein
MTPCGGEVTEGVNPTLVDGKFPMPTCSPIVIQVVVNNGEVSPDAQQGYQISINPAGQAVVAIQRPGTPGPSIQVVELGEDGLQSLLQELLEIGFFELEPPPAFGTPIVGAPSNWLSVWIGDQIWQADGAFLSPDDLDTLNRAQQAVIDAIGVPVT